MTTEEIKYKILKLLHEIHDNESLMEIHEFVSYKTGPIDPVHEKKKDEKKALHDPDSTNVKKTVRDVLLGKQKDFNHSLDL